MAKASTQYVCQSCGASHRKWAGRCEGCGEWNTLVEEVRAESVPRGLGSGIREFKTSVKDDPDRLPEGDDDED